MTKTKKSLTALMLLACAALMPACDVLNRPCNPDIEICVFTNGNPDTLDPSQNGG